MVRDKLGALDDSERGELLPVDTERMQAEMKRRGLEFE
jgi:hypothetical protein